MRGCSAAVFAARIGQVRVDGVRLLYGLFTGDAFAARSCLFLARDDFAAAGRSQPFLCFPPQFGSFLASRLESSGWRANRDSRKQECQGDADRDDNPDPERHALSPPVVS